MSSEQGIQTELGTIPNDWQYGKFEDFMDGFSSGMTPYRGNKDFYTGDIPWITSGELNYNVITDTFEKITIDAIRKTNLKIIPKGTFLMAITGLEAEGTRGSCSITGIDAATNQSCMALYPKPSVLISDYLYHFYVLYGNELAFKYCQGTKQQSYNAVTAKKLPIAFPKSLLEQKAIASTLTNASYLIENLEKLIAKNQLLWESVMQQSFIPKETWEVKTIDDVVLKISGGGTPPRLIREYWNGNIPWMTVKDFNSFNKLSTQEYITDSGLKNSSTRIVPKGEIIIATRISIGAIAIYEIDVSINQDLKWISLRECVNKLYFYYFYKSITSKIIEKGSGSTVLGLSLNDLKSFQIPVPPLSAQEDIAATLLAMDQGIESLEQKLHKARQIKHAMMQQLLTGKIRLRKRRDISSSQEPVN